MVKYHVEREYETEAFRHSAKFVCGGAYVCHAVSVLLDASNLSEKSERCFSSASRLDFYANAGNYEELFVTGSFGRYFFNSFVVCVLSIILALLVGIPSAISLPVVSFGLRRPFFMCF